MSKLKIFSSELYTDIIPYRVEMQYNEQRRLNLFEMFWITVVQCKGTEQDYLHLTLEQLVQRAQLEPNLAYTALEELVRNYQYLTVGDHELSLQIRVNDLEFSAQGMEFVGRTPAQLQVLAAHGKKHAVLPEPQGIRLFYNSLTQQASSEALAYAELPRNVREPQVSGKPQYPAYTDKLPSLYISNQSGILGTINQQAFDAQLVREVLEQHLQDNIARYPWYSDKVELLGDPEWERTGEPRYQRIEYALVYDTQECKFELSFAGSVQELQPYQQWLNSQKFAGNDLWFYLVRSQVGTAQAPQIESTLDWSRVVSLRPAVIASNPALIQFVPLAGSELRQWQLLDQRVPQLKLHFSLSAEVVRQIQTALCSIRSSQATWYYDSERKQVCVRSLGRITNGSFYNATARELDVVVTAQVPEITGDILFAAVREEFERQYQELAHAPAASKTPLFQNYLQQLRYLTQDFISVADVLAEITRLVQEYELKLSIEYLASYVQQVPSVQRAQWRSLVWMPLLPRPTTYAQLEAYTSLLPNSTLLEREYLQSAAIRRDLFLALLTDNVRARELVTVLDDTRFQALAQITSKLYSIEHLRNIVRQASSTSNLELRVSKLSGNNAVQLQAFLVFLRDYFPEYAQELQTMQPPLFRAAQRVRQELASRWQQAQRIALVTYDYLRTRGARDLLSLERRFHQVIIVEPALNRFTKEYQRCVDKQNRNDYSGPDDVIYTENILKSQELMGKPGLLASMGDIAPYCDLLQTQMDRMFDDYQVKQRPKYPKVQFTPPTLGEYRRTIACTQYFKAHQVYVFAADNHDSSDQLLTSFLRDTGWRDEHVQVVHDIPQQLELLDSDTVNSVSRVIPSIELDPLQIFHLANVARLGGDLNAYYGNTESEEGKTPFATSQSQPIEPAANHIVNPDLEVISLDTQITEVSAHVDCEYSPSEISSQANREDSYSTSTHSLSSFEEPSAELAYQQPPQEWHIDSWHDSQTTTSMSSATSEAIELNSPELQGWGGLSSLQTERNLEVSTEVRAYIEQCKKFGKDLDTSCKLNASEVNKIRLDFQAQHARYGSTRVTESNLQKIRAYLQKIQQKYPDSQVEFPAQDNTSALQNDFLVFHDERVSFGEMFNLS